MPIGGHTAARRRPAHMSRLVRDWLGQHNPDFIKKGEWPPNSPDHLHPLDFHVWGAMIEKYKAYTPKLKNKAELKVVLQEIWERSSPSVYQARYSVVQKQTPGMHQSSRWSLLYPPISSQSSSSIWPFQGHHNFQKESIEYVFIARLNENFDCFCKISITSVPLHIFY